MTTAHKGNTDRAGLYRRLHRGQHRDQQSLRDRSADRIVSVLHECFRPDSVLDVGCGTGSFLAALARYGVSDLQGIEGPWLDPSQIGVPNVRVGTRDLERPFDLGRRFDLVVSLEVAEHLSSERAAGFVADLVRHGDLVLFSAAVPFQGGAGHLNERWPSWWAEKFAGYGFVAVDLFRPRLWEDTGVLWWLRQNLILYAHPRQLRALPRLADFFRGSRAAMPLDVVHPILLAQYAHRARFDGPVQARMATGEGRAE